MIYQRNAYFSIEYIVDELSSLCNVTSVSSDDFPGIFLFNLRFLIAGPLCLLFRKSLDQGLYPTLFKLCSITPLFKSGDASKVENYKLIAITSHISKRFESIVFKSIKPSVNSILVNEQHSFRPGWSTITCNMSFCNYIIDALQHLHLYRFLRGF